MLRASTAAPFLAQHGLLRQWQLKKALPGEKKFKLLLALLAAAQDQDFQVLCKLRTIWRRC